METEVELPTEYRIVPIKNVVIHYYLQFRHVHRFKVLESRGWFRKREEVYRTEESWRFVYKNDDGIEDVLYPDQCPARMISYDFRLFRSYDFDRGKLHRFAEQWQRIEDYYAEARRKRQERKERQAREEREAKVVYLTPGGKGLKSRER